VTHPSTESDSVPSFVFPHTNLRLAPEARNDLVKMHDAGEQLVREDARREVYIRAIDAYSAYLVQLAILPEKQRTAIMYAARASDQSVTRSILYRLNCQVLRFISGLGGCNQACCCRCVATYQDIACNEIITEFDPDQQEDQASLN